MISRKSILLLCLILVIRVSVATAQGKNLDSVSYTPMAEPKSKLKQTNASKQIEYFFNVQSGALVGCNDCGKGKEFTFSVATGNGITLGSKFRAGFAIGFDSYQNWQALPLFGMASWDLMGNKTKNTLFIQMNYGWAHAWFVRDGFYSGYTYDPFSNVSGGRMINPQIGYRVSYYNLRLSFVAGYKLQQIHYKKPSYYYPNCPYCDFPQQSFDEITQDMNRIQLIMSVGWK